ncbi:hypothetical protein JCM10212_005355 [Sporobolomyces blumeae]
MSLYGPPVRNKLRREGIERTVLPPQPGPRTYSSAYTYTGVGHTGYQVSPAPTTGGAGAGGAAGSIRSTRRDGVLGSIKTSASSGGGGLAGTGAKLQQRIEEVKERQKERRERHHTRSRPDEIQKSNLIVDADGVAHDSEYVQFRTATPVHVQARTARRHRRQIDGIPDDDDSASSASSSSTSSSESGFQSSPYTYESTHRTGSSAHRHHHHHHSSTLYPPTRSAIPPYLASQHRSSLDVGGGPSSLSVPRAPSPSKRSSGEYDRSSLDRSNSGIGTGGSSLRHASSSSRLRGTRGGGGGGGGAGGSGRGDPASGHQFSTSSFQPPAAFNPRPPALFSIEPVARLTASGSSTTHPHLTPSSTTARPHSDSRSLLSSTAKLSLNSPPTVATGGGGGGQNNNESGYNKYARDSKTRPPKMDGNMLDAGVHGMKRSWDGFKLDMRFGAHKMAKKLDRKVNSAIL